MDSALITTMQAVSTLQDALIQQAKDIKELRKTCERIIARLEEMRKENNA